MNGYEEPSARRRGTEPGSSCSTPLTHSSHSASGFAPSSSRPGRRPKGLIEDDQRLHSLDAGFGAGGHGNAGLRPSSADYSRNTSGSSSPINAKDSLDRLQGRSASLSSDDVTGATHEECRLSQSSLLHRSSTLPCDTPPAPRSTPRSSTRPTRHRTSSPGSEMVTLEEFLQESNVHSPPTVQTGSREDLMSDYFARTGRPAPLRDGAKTPTSYVMPTVKTPPSGPDGRASKPGHSVKPSMRLVETSTPPSQSQTLPNRGASGPGGRPSPQQHAGPRGAGGAAGLSRTFSLASADLLRSTGPDAYRAEAGLPSQTEGVVRRLGVMGSERPQSARLACPSSLSGDPSLPAVDPRRLSVAPPRAEPPLPISSTPVQAEQRTGRPAAQHHRGEVALVTPVRAVSALRLDEEMEPGEHSHVDPLPLKKADSPGCGRKEQPSSSPASPDPNNDPQTVWYEYGCV